MKIFNISILLSSFFSILFQLLSYKELSNKKLEFTKKNIVYFIIIFWLVIFNNVYNIEILTAPFGFLLLVMVNYLFYKDKMYITFNTVLLNYIIAIFIEILFTIFITVFGIVSIDEFKEYNFLILLFTFITMFSSYMICRYFKFLKKILSKINECYENNTFKLFIIVLFIFILLIIDYKGVSHFTLTTYIVNIVISILIIIIFIAYIKNELIIKTEIRRIDILLDNIYKYEKYIDDNRIGNHELLNNLLLLKSIKNKNTKKFENLLDEIICIYNNDSIFVKNLSILPKGIKGLIYYKLYDLESMGCKFNVRISKRISNLIEKVEDSEYIILCKIIPILLDNSIDSLRCNDEKVLIFDIYKEKDYLVVCIENSCEEYVDVKSINHKYFSSKGSSRGLGLYILNRLLKKSKHISLYQEYKNNYFVSKIIIK